MSDILFPVAGGASKRLVDQGDGTYAERVSTVSTNTLASGKTPVTGTFVATGQSANFTPTPGRGFNVSFWGTFVATVQLERSPDGGTTWIAAAAARSAPDTFICDEVEASVLYRLNCTAYTSGTVNYRVAQ